MRIQNRGTEKRGMKKLNAMKAKKNELSEFHYKSLIIGKEG